MINLDDLRTAHAEGNTFVGYADDNKSIVTGGSDGDLRVYPGLYDDETSAVSAGTKITSLDVDINRVIPSGLEWLSFFYSGLGKLVAVSNEAHEVKSYSFPDLQLENVLLRFTASINHVCINKGVKMLAAASSDFSMKSVNLDGTEQKTYIGHEAPVLSLYIEKDKMISSSCDGTIRVWNLDDQKCIKTLNVLPKSNSIVDNGSLLSVTENGDKNLAVPSDKTIKIFSCDSWEEKFQLEEHTDIVTIVKWSPCGKYLASSAKNGEIFGWDFSTKKCFAKFQHHEKKCITSLNWNRKNNGELLFAATEGDFGYCQLPIKDFSGAKDDDHEMLLDDIDMGDDIDVDEEISASIKPSSSDETQKKRVVQMDDDDDDDDDDIMPTLSKKRKMSRNNSLLNDHADVDHDDDDGDENDDAKDVYAEKNDIYMEKEDDADGDYRDPYDIDNDAYEDSNTTIGLIKEGLIPESKPDLDDEDSRASTLLDEKIPAPVKHIKSVEMELQEAFQPSATGINLLHRYMLWNSVGIIRCHVEDDVSFIDVEFHDTSTYHPLHIPNVLNHTMASLTETAVVFACESDDSMPSKLACTHFGSWDSNKDWDVSMPEGESIEAIAANKTHVVAATNERLVRVFSISGSQTQLLSLHGPVVSMAMHEKQLLIFYLKSGGFNDCHCFGVLQLHLRKNTWKVASDSTFISKPKSILSWIGFSVEGTPVLAESSGEVLLYHRQQMTWMPIANTIKTLKSKSDNHWILGVEESRKQIRCIYSRGTNFPTTSPRPVPIFLPFQIPLCEITTEKSIKEGELMKCSLTSSNIKYNRESLRTKIEVELQDVEKQQIRLLMQLFALACKSDQEFRAVEICNMMPNAECIGMAIQYACKVRKMPLAEKLTELARKRAATEEEEEEENEEAEVYEEEVEDDDDEEFEMESQESTRSSISSGPKMAVIRPKSTSSRRPVEESMEENSSQDIEMTQEDDTQSDPVAKQPSLSTSGGGNPFKRNKPQSISDAKSRGTEYFETLQSQHAAKKAKPNTDESSKNTTKKSTEKKSINKKKSTISFTTNRKKAAAANGNSESGEEKSKKQKAESPKLTGFQMFMETLKEGDSDENIVPKAMRQWKGLSTEEKEEWNQKAKGGENINGNKENKMAKSTENSEDTNTDEKEEINEDQGETKVKEAKKIPKARDAKKVSDVKNASRQKLAAFSFQK